LKEEMPFWRKESRTSERTNGFRKQLSILKLLF